MSVSVPTAPPLALFATGMFPMPFKLRANDAAEFNRLCHALPVAIERATHVLRESSCESAGYVAADAEVLKILERITVITNELK
jgi:hypothetical protein